MRSGISRYRNSAPNLPIAKIFAAPFVYEDIPRSGQKYIVEQRSVPPTTYQNFRRIGALLPGTVGAPTCLLSGKRDGTEIHCIVPITDGISAFQVHRIYRQTLLQYSPAPCVRPIRSGFSR